MPRKNQNPADAGSFDNARAAGDSIDRNSATTDWQAAWETEDNYWQENFSSRPYSMGRDYYDRFRPAYRYGYESAHLHSAARDWDEIEPELRSGWDRYEHAGDGRSAWEQIKDAVRDAWERVKGEPAHRR
jgi:hypothetical protein